MYEILNDMHGFIVSVFIISILACYSNFQKRYMEFTALLLVFAIYGVAYVLFSKNIYEGIIGSLLK